MMSYLVSPSPDLPGSSKDPHFGSASVSSPAIVKPAKSAISANSVKSAKYETKAITIKS